MRVLSTAGINYHHALTEQLAEMCSMQHVQLHSQIREELNQELASHGARGQWPSLLSEERQILLLKICNLATEQLTGRIRTWPDSNSCHGRWTRISFVFIRVWQYTRVSGSDNTEKYWSFFFNPLSKREELIDRCSVVNLSSKTGQNRDLLHRLLHICKNGV